MPGRHNGEAAERLPQLSRYLSEILLSRFLLLPQVRFSPQSPAPIPASLRQLMTHSASAKSFAAAVLLGRVSGLGTEEEEASQLQGEVIRAARSTDQTDPCDELQGSLLPCSGPAPCGAPTMRMDRPASTHLQRQL